MIHDMKYSVCVKHGVRSKVCLSLTSIFSSFRVSSTFKGSKHTAVFLQVKRVRARAVFLEIKRARLRIIRSNFFFSFVVMSHEILTRIRGSPSPFGRLDTGPSWGGIARRQGTGGTKLIRDTPPPGLICGVFDDGTL